jgi:hypothetical protein
MTEKKFYKAFYLSEHLDCQVFVNWYFDGSDDIKKTLNIAEVEYILELEDIKEVDGLHKDVNKIYKFMVDNCCDIVLV